MFTFFFCSDSLVVFVLAAWLGVVAGLTSLHILSAVDQKRTFKVADGEGQTFHDEMLFGPFGVNFAPVFQMNRIEQKLFWVPDFQMYR